MAKPKYIFEIKEGKQVRRWSVTCLSSCPLGAGGAGCRGYPLLWCRVPAFLSALSLCLWWDARKYGSISHSKGVLTGFLLLRVGLLGLRALRGLCGFCVREWLGG